MIRVKVAAVLILFVMGGDVRVPTHALTEARKSFEDKCARAGRQLVDYYESVRTGAPLPKVENQAADAIYCANQAGYVAIMDKYLENNGEIER